MPDFRRPQPTAPHRTDEDYDTALRPQTLDAFIGQQKIKDNLRVFITAALQRGETLDHVLLSGPPGLGKCITADSLILTEEGLVPFRDLLPDGMTPGESRPLVVEVHGIDGPEKTSHVYYSGCVPTLRLRTAAGFTIEGTPHHPVLVASPQGPRWKPLGELTSDDHVGLARGAERWGRTQHQAVWKPDANADRRRRSERRVARLHAELTTALGRSPTAGELQRAYQRLYDVSHAPTPVQTAHRMKLSLTHGRDTVAANKPWTLAIPVESEERHIMLDADLAYLLGAVVGDGHMERGAAHPAFVITCGEDAMQRELQSITQKHFGRRPRAARYGERTARLRFSKTLGRTLVAFGLTPAGAAGKTVPAAILTSPRDVVIGFLQGLFDADGHARTDGYVEWSTRSEALAGQVQLLLLNLGIVGYRSVRDVQGTPCWRLFIGGADARLFYELVGFRLARKQDRARWLPVQGGPERSDRVPHANPLLAELLRATAPHPRALHKRFDHVKRDDRTPSRGQIERYVSLLPDVIRDAPAYWVLQALADPTIQWDRVADICEGEADTYDFVVPGTHSFVAGGLFNHNTTLAHICAEEMGAQIKTTSGPVLDKPASIAGLLTNLEEGDVLFIDEIHRLTSVVEEYLYSAMEDYHIDIVIDSGPNARSVKIELPPFTLIGATTRKGLLTAPMRARFGIDFRYDYYTAELLHEIVLRSARILRVEATEEGAFEIARRSRGTPRIANRLLRRTRDFAEVEGDGRITREIADHALNALDVDEEGLDDMDTRILLTLIEKFGGGPTGLNNLAVSVGEDAGTIEEVYEPYLIQEGFMERTPRGRVATPRAYAHFGATPPPKEGDLFGLA